MQEHQQHAEFQIKLVQHTRHALSSPSAKKYKLQLSYVSFTFVFVCFFLCYCSFIVFLRVTFTLPCPDLKSSRIKVTVLVRFCLPSTQGTISKTHLDCLFVLFVVKGELPDQFKSKLFGFPVDTAEEVKIMVHQYERYLYTHSHTHRRSHHYSMASPYEAILVTDLCLLLLCHQRRHVTWSLWQPQHDVK